MGNIFINYRRSDEPNAAGRLYDKLCLFFDPDQIFMDISSINPGVDFESEIRNVLNNTDIFILVIGKNWTKSGKKFWKQNRIFKKRDFVRIEIEEAIKRNLVILPILIDDAELPKEKNIPKSISRILEINYLKLQYEFFQKNSDDIIDYINRKFSDIENEKNMTKEQWLNGGNHIERKYFSNDLQNLKEIECDRVDIEGISSSSSMFFHEIVDETYILNNISQNSTSQNFEDIEHNLFIAFQHSEFGRIEGNFIKFINSALYITAEYFIQCDLKAYSHRNVNIECAKYKIPYFVSDISKNISRKDIIRIDIDDSTYSNNFYKLDHNNNDIIIGTKQASSLFDLVETNEVIEVSSGTMRCLLLSKKKLEADSKSKLDVITSVILNFDIRQNGVHRTLLAAHTNNVKVITIERVVSKDMNKLKFFFEFLTHPETLSGARMLDEIASFSSSIKIMGVFRASTYRNIETD